MRENLNLDEADAVTVEEVDMLLQRVGLYKPKRDAAIMGDKPMMRACIYLRTSGDKQRDNTSLDTQEEQSRIYCENENYQVACVDRKEAVSAKSSNFVRIVELLDYCKKNRGKFDVLIVWKLDRFARSMEHHWWLRGQLAQIGVYLRSATERIDESPAGRLIEGVISAVNEYDNAVRKERIKLAMWKRADEGMWPWAVPDGYKRLKVPNVRLSVSEFD